VGGLAGVPVTAGAARLVRWAAPVVAVRLPGLGPLAVRDYGVLGGVRHPWWITEALALLGAASHVAWDHVTHESIAGTGLGLPALAREAVPGVPW
jgi:hypothetical protein